MKRFKRSWELAKVSFWVIRKDKEMLLFPLFAGILSVLFSALIIIFTDVVQYLETEQSYKRPCRASCTLAPVLWPDLHSFVL